MDRCVVCGSQHNLVEHLVFFEDGLDEISEQYDEFKAILCDRCHYDEHGGVHGQNVMLDLRLKATAQIDFIRKYGVLEYIKLIDRDYIQQDAFYGVQALLTNDIT